jgi:hypothetical protein
MAEWIGHFHPTNALQPWRWAMALAWGMAVWYQRGYVPANRGVPKVRSGHRATNAFQVIFAVPAVVGQACFLRGIGAGTLDGHQYCDNTTRRSNSWALSSAQAEKSTAPPLFQTTATSRRQQPCRLQRASRIGLGSQIGFLSLETATEGEFVSLGEQTEIVGAFLYELSFTFPCHHI